MMMRRALLALALAGSSARAQQCAAPVRECLRGSGNDVLKVFDAGTPQAASPGACCAACAAHPGCVAAMIVSRNGRAAECWLERIQDVKAPLPTEDCNATLISQPPPPQRFNRTSFSGVWLQHGSLSDLVNQSYLVGGDLPVKWSDVEVADGVFDWTSVDTAFAAAAAQGYYIETALTTGDAAPAWLYNRTLGPSVPMVTVIPGKDKNRVIFPFYLDAAYAPLFLRAIRAFSDHIATLPPAVRAVVVASQAMFGSTGDDTPWHGTPVNAAFNISRAQWHNFTLDLSPTVCALYHAHNTSVLWNPGDDCANCTDILYRMCPGSFFKSGMESHGLFINYEADDLETIHGPLCHLAGMHCRGEDWPYPTTGAFAEAPAWGQYWHLLELLTFALDMPGLSEPQLFDGWASFYDTFNRYAGSVRPPARDWVGGIVALRDGLDSANTDRFPEATFGAAVVTNKARLLAIAQAFKSRGAAEGDPDSAAQPVPMDSRTPKAMNDVGWRVLEGNFGNGAITQVAANETSVGWWRVGSKADPFGRYARGFESASGKTAMSFVLDTRLWGGLPLAAGGGGVSLLLRVVYFDAKRAGFTVAYDAGSGCRNATSVTTGESAEWKNVTLAIDDGRFARSCGPAGADIALFSTTAADAIVHSVEIFRP
jgi:hypothetical protein